MELRSYQRITDDADGDNDNEEEDEEEEELEENEVISPLQASIPVSVSTVKSNDPARSSSDEKASNPESLKIKVLKGEQSKTITVPRLASVSQLKSLIEPVYGVPVAQQRLVCKGKPLRPDEDSLASFSILDGAVLHLFPLPSNAPSTAHTSGGTNLPNFTYTRNDLIPGLPAHLMRPVHFVPEVVQSIREVKMWCYILIIISSMDIFTNLSFLASQGHAGRGLFDSILNIIQTVFSVVGLYVGQLGLQCTTSAESDAIKQYVHSLTALAVVNILIKAAWVVDVILLAKKSLKEDGDEDEDEEAQDDGRNVPGKGGGQYVDDPDSENGAEPMSDSSFMIYFSIQAVIMAGIAISMWCACVNRARTFQRLVRSYEGIANRA